MRIQLIAGFGAAMIAVHLHEGNAGVVPESLTIDEWSIFWTVAAAYVLSAAGIYQIWVVMRDCAERTGIPPATFILRKLTWVIPMLLPVPSVVAILFRTEVSPGNGSLGIRVAAAITGWLLAYVISFLALLAACLLAPKAASFLANSSAFRLIWQENVIKTAVDKGLPIWDPGIALVLKVRLKATYPNGYSDAQGELYAGIG